ncbi:hypothetical protein G4B88_002207 [Cannabis sativa]|uniref:Uncharacterized protein n=2 Tax=Cannabis sativa TaxID=3483 RepID=A0AB40EAW9_CANSA|nr:hypothetical protein G4B88_002207 [Cannabis sativa]
MMKKFMVIALVVGVMVVGCFGRLQSDVHLNLVPNRCMVPGEYCHWAQHKTCCEGLHCEGERGWGENRKCVHVTNCLQAGYSCAALSPPCCYPMRCTSIQRGGLCATPGLELDVQQNAS